MSTLAEIVASLRVGDKVRATFAYLNEAFVLEGKVHNSGKHLPGELSIGGRGIRWTNNRVPDSLLNLEILERAESDFYTNAPGRKPRIGDVADHGGGLGDVAPGRFVFDGRSWHRDQTFEAHLPSVYNFGPGYLALVDPFESGGE